MPTTRDYYEILSVERTADGDEIKRAYGWPALEYFRDREELNTETQRHRGGQNAGEEWSGSADLRDHRSCDRSSQSSRTGLLESVYEECLAIELADRGVEHQRQVPVPVSFKGRQIDLAYRMDMLVNVQVVLELKAIEKLMPVHEVQLMTYMRLSGMKTGLLINFHTPYLRDSIVRRVL
jgi:GxxExxY protein